MRSYNRWAFLWLEWERVGHVETLSLFGFTLYRRSGQILNILGTEIILK